MKKIISIAIALTMICAMLLTVVSAGAATVEELKELIATAEALVAEDYTDASWTNLQAALAAAARGTAENASAAAISMGIRQLTSALEGLEVDLAPLNALFDKAELFAEKHKYADKYGEHDVLDENGDYVIDENGNYVKDSPYDGDYTPENWQMIQDVLKEAKNAATTNDLETIKKAVADLSAALEVEYLPIDEETKVKLAELLELADILEPFSHEFSDSAWGMVALKVEQGLKVGEEDYKISTYLKATSELETALKNLTPDKELPKPFPLNYVNIDKLMEFIDVEFTAEMFTAESWGTLMSAYDAAKVARETAKKQVDVDAAYQTLKAAFDNMTLAPVPTQQPTEAPTDAPAATEAPKASGGCGGSVVATVAVVAVVATLGTVVLKKKEN